MNEQELLQKIKKSLGITSNYHDDTLIEHIHEVKNYLTSAGVKPNVVNSSISSGVIAKGVSDLWNNGSGVTNLSPYFLQRASQLALEGGTVTRFQTKTVSPTIEQQEVVADSGYEALEKVTVNAVTSSIDNNIQAENIKSGISILGVEGTFDKTLATKNIEHNGTYNASSDNVDGYSQVNVNIGSAALDERTIVDNGTYMAVDDDLDGYSTVIVNVPDPTPVLENKTITENGTYRASAGYDGLGEIIVDVRGTADGEIGFITNSSTTFGMNLTIQTDIPDYALQITNSAYAYVEEVGFTDGCIQIGDSAFKNQKNMTLVSYPNKATLIDNSAFINCSSIKNIVLESATDIRASAFANCTNLLTVNLPKIELLNNNNGGGQFSNCSKLTTVRIGDAIRTIGEYTFGRCALLTAIYIDLPRATVEAMSGYQYAWSRITTTTQTLQPSVIICNDDPNWVDG